MSSEEDEEELEEGVARSIRSIRDAARRRTSQRPRLEPYRGTGEGAAALGPVTVAADAAPHPPSPDREEVNALWQVSSALEEPPRGGLGRLLAPLRRPLQRWVRFALGPFVERQERMNSAQVRFDNDVVRYIDDRLDRVSRHYDHVIGLHGKRMEEIDERHLILQQELIRHVHDLVERIEFVFESAEQNHLYLEAQLREAREELARIAERLEAGVQPAGDGT